MCIMCNIKLIPSGSLMENHLDMDVDIFFFLFFLVKKLRKCQNS